MAVREEIPRIAALGIEDGKQFYQRLREVLLEISSPHFFALTRFPARKINLGNGRTRRAGIRRKSKKRDSRNCHESQAKARLRRTAWTTGMIHLRDRGFGIVTRVKIKEADPHVAH